MSIGIRLRQYSSRVIRLSMRPWVAAGATITLVFFYLAIFSAASIHINSDPQAIKDDETVKPPLNRSSHQIQVKQQQQQQQQQRQKMQQEQQHQQQEQQQQQQQQQQKSPNDDDHHLLNFKDSYDKDYLAFLRQPIINFHNFSYVHNMPDVCTSRRPGVDLVIVSPSGPGNFYRRMMARKSGRTTYTGNPANRALHLFFLGSSRDPAIQRKVAAESKRYGDIVQESYVDVYANITFKAVQMLKWVSLFCNRSSYVIRLDDDVTADVARLAHAMARTRGAHPEFVLGEVKRGWPPCQIPKCRTTKEEYPYATLMPFALGGALGYPTTSVQRLYQATRRVKRFKLDDVYITGMCAPKVGVKLLHDDEFVFQHDAW